MAWKFFSEFVSPMMAESAKAPFDAMDWIFEIKFGGLRNFRRFSARSCERGTE
jgi:ATP-dependent DNA ligase